MPTVTTTKFTPFLTKLQNLPEIEVYRHVGLGKAPELVISSTKGVLNTKDSVAITTYNAALDTIRYYQGEFGRNSYDNKGGKVKLVVGYSESDGAPMNNAFWNGDDKTMYFGDGDGKLFSPLGTARDIVAHEFGHAIISSEVKLGYSGQSGGIHESVSDVWATGIDGNLLIGEDSFTPHVPGDGLRDLENPHWKHVKDLPQDPPYKGEPHVMSEPLSYAAVLASKSVGLDKVRKIWYTAIVENLKDHSGFAGFRQATEGAALKLYGPEARQSIEDAWKAVGINR
jgi:Zn-dependent metalloprotease